MTSKPIVSVLVPNYNHAAFLEKRLETIFEQNFQDFEIILLDDCSTDNSRNILLNYTKHPKVSHCVFNRENSGNTFSQWSKGIELAKGELIWVAESDDYCEPDFLERMVKEISRDENISLVFCQSHKVNAYNEVTGSWLEETRHFNKNIFINDFCIEGNKFIEDYLIFQNVIPNASAVLFKKETAVERRLPDTSVELKYSGDWLFYLQILVNKKIVFVSESLNNFRYHETSVIAGARKVETIATIVDRDFKMRSKMKSFLKDRNPENLNEIIKENILVTRKFQLKKAFSLFRSKKRLEGLVTLIPVIDLYIKNLKFFKRMKSTINSFFKKET